MLDRMIEAGALPRKHTLASARFIRGKRKETAEKRKRDEDENKRYHGC